MTANPQFAGMVLDLLSEMGPVNNRRMFGGAGLFMDGVMFALIASEMLYLKVDAQNQPAFEDLSLETLTYERQGKWITLSYFKAPDECFDDPDVMMDWCQDAWEAAKRSKSVGN
jgi:DNA transformation protein